VSQPLAPLLVAGLVLVVLGLMLGGLWVGMEGSRRRDTPAKTRTLRQDAHGHLLRSAFMLLGGGGVLMAVPLWLPLTTLAPPHSPLPIERQARPGSVAFDIAGEWTVINTILDTQYAAYRDLQLGFRQVKGGNGATLPLCTIAFPCHE
jgi:hypothetical protein